MSDLALSSLVSLRPRSASNPDRPVVVMKFGSSILASPEDAPKAASDIYTEVRHGRRVVAVVSAFAGETNRLLGEARAIGLSHDNRHLPAYVVQGEERSAALVAVACDRIGLDATILTVRELGLRAEGPSEHAHPVSLDSRALEKALERHEVVVVPGFGALSAEGGLVLLGRGGSDLTALFLAAQLGLDSVQLVKDVDGLYEQDPKAYPDTRRYDRASWADAKALGGDLVQPEALDMAQSRGVRLEVRNHLDGHRTIVGPVSAPPRKVRADRPLRVAVAGCGVVGAGVLSRLQHDPRIEVVGVLVRDRTRPRDIPGAGKDFLDPLLVDSPEALLDRDSDIVLEALSEPAAGYDLIRSCLARGVHVASANKQAVSRDPSGLRALAQANGAKLLWSASVGGGVPMIEALKAAKAQGPVACVQAVVNGTVNFMLSHLAAGASFDEALEAAQDAGFAEANPSADLEGLDAVAKIRLLSFEAFGAMPDEAEIPRDVLNRDALLARGTRQICRCRMQDGRIQAAVRLLSGPIDPLFAGLKGEENGMKITLEDGSVIHRRGRGAGRWATSESLLGDLSDLIAHHRRPSAW